MIKFDKNRHTYTNDGMPVPSVTKIISMLYPNKYDGIPEKILAEKAQYGNKVHEWIENYALTGKRKRQSELMKISTRQVEALLNERDVKVMRCEEIVAGDGYCGMYDMYGTVAGETAMIDIKTTAELDYEYLTWQLGMYKTAMEIGGCDVSKCYCLWVPKGGLVRLAEIEPKSKEEIEWLVFRYEQEHIAG